MNTRLWHVTLSWRHKKQQYEQDILLCAPDKDTASDMAKNRIPIHLLEQDNSMDTIQIRTRDLGMPQNHKTYFASKVKASTKENGIIPLEEQIALSFAIMWGHETGYRAGNPYVSVTETEQMQKLYNYDEKEHQIYEWAKEYLSENTKQPKEFFRKKLSELLEDTITNVEQLEPIVMLTDIDSSEQQARAIIESAKKQANELLDSYQTRVTDELNTAKELVETLKTLKLVPQEQQPVTASISEPAFRPDTVMPEVSPEEPELNPDPIKKEDMNADDNTDPETQYETDVYQDDPKELPFTNEDSGIQKPASDEVIDAILNDTDAPKTEESLQEQDADATDVSNQEQPAATDDASSEESEENADEQTTDPAQNPNQNPDSEPNGQPEAVHKPEPQEKPEITPAPKPKKPDPIRISIEDLGSIVRIIETQDLLEPETFDTIKKILTKFTIRTKNGSFHAINIYNNVCKNQDVDPDGREIINIEFMLDLLVMTNRIKGMSGWDFMTAKIRNMYPGCEFNIPIPHRIE